MNKESKNLDVVELFAGVGGFRIGLCGTNDKPLKGFNLKWANQWEPGSKMQHAALVYKDKFHNGEEPNEHFNEDINQVVELEDLPVPKHDLLVAGFPCQDYSVARTLSHAAGIEGKKGVLWWAIHKILSRMGDKAPRYLMLENVDRLLKSPAKQRGRDFGIILATLSDLGYAVEWRVVNAADYGMPQRRRRIFILGYRNNSPVYRKLKKTNPLEWITKKGTIAHAFPVESENKMLVSEVQLEGDAPALSDSFAYNFENAGLMRDRKIYTTKTSPIYDGERVLLGDVLLNKAPEEYLIPKKDQKVWKYLKGKKDELRKTKDGFEYHYKEGPIAFPDNLERASRTIITSEGGHTPSRFKHVIQQGSALRRLTPIELERLCMFPDNHTKHPLVGDVKRAFFMGNALVVGVIERLGRSLLDAHRRK